MEEINRFFKKIGVKKEPKINYNFSEKELYRISEAKREGVLSKKGVLTVYTGKYTGRSPKDKFVAENKIYAKNIFWGRTNVPISDENFTKLLQKTTEYLESLNEIFIFEGSAGADEKQSLPVRVISEYAWHSLFSSIMLRKKLPVTQDNESLTIIVMPGCRADGAADGVNSEAFILVDFSKKLVLIGGTRYAGEIKKSVFTFLNYMFPANNVFPMHCSATEGKQKDVALYFGLSGTGKTTLSADPERILIGDDEHGWSDSGIFNFEGGCYAKCVNLDAEKEPQIFSAIKDGAIVENVVIDKKSGEYDFTDTSLTENSRVAYPLNFIPNASKTGMGGQPKNIFFLTADAFGILPPIARLTIDQALFYFLCGYTSKLAGTERGIKEPQAIFSLFFGEPFFPLSPRNYLDLFLRLLKKHEPNVYLVNTGWSGGGYGIGKRMPLPVTRALISSVLSGEMNKIEWKKEKYFNLYIPKKCSGAPDEILDPVKSWKDAVLYGKQAEKLKLLFEENFKKYKIDYDDVMGQSDDKAPF